MTGKPAAMRSTAPPIGPPLVEVDNSGVCQTNSSNDCQVLSPLRVISPTNCNSNFVGSRLRSVNRDNEVNTYVKTRHFPNKSNFTERSPKIPRKQQITLNLIPSNGCVRSSIGRASYLHPHAMTGAISPTIRADYPTIKNSSAVSPILVSNCQLADIPVLHRQLNPKSDTLRYRRAVEQLNARNTQKLQRLF